MDLFITKQGERIKELEAMLRTVTHELRFMINRENARLASEISSTDLDDPDYLDFETVQQAMVLLGKTKVNAVDK